VGTLRREHPEYGTRRIRDAGDDAGEDPASGQGQLSPLAADPEEPPE
jgi:hypothetical protein